MKILFILKDRFYSYSHSNSYGLSNSARLVVEYLEEIGNQCKIVTVIDGNFIDKEIHQYNPDVVIIEALWVSGSKLNELLNLYPNVNWVVRIHSNIGFLSTETMALKYVNDYVKLNNNKLSISFNNDELNYRMREIMGYNFTYLPNIITEFGHKKFSHNKAIIHIGCFGH